MKLEDYSLRLAQLISDIEAAEENGWIRDAHFTPWVDKYNSLVTAFNSDFSRNVSKYGISETTHSKSDHLAYELYDPLFLLMSHHALQ